MSLGDGVVVMTIARRKGRPEPEVAPPDPPEEPPEPAWGGLTGGGFPPLVPPPEGGTTRMVFGVVRRAPRSPGEENEKLEPRRMR